MSLHDLITQTRYSLDYFDGMNAATLPEIERDGILHPIACAAGCCFCCHLDVEVSASEILLLTDAITRAGDAEMIAQRVRAARVRVANRTVAERKSATIACPLLADDGTCRVYEVRPLACRAWVSCDWDACRTNWEMPEAGIRVPLSGPLRHWAAKIAAQIQARQQRMGLAAGTYELIRALDIALSTPDIAALLLAGEDILAPAHFAR